MGVESCRASPAPPVGRPVYGTPYLGHGLRRPNFVSKFGASVKSSCPTADSSCCGAQNSLLADCSQNFDRCHSFLLASSATGGARKRPPLHKGAFGTGDADRRVGPAGLLAMTTVFCHSEERSDVGIRPFLRWTGGRTAVPRAWPPPAKFRAEIWGVGQVVGPYGRSAV